VRLALPLDTNAPFNWLARRWGLTIRPRTWRDTVVDWCATVMLASLSFLGWAALALLAVDGL
jgi:hypothetical protein